MVSIGRRETSELHLKTWSWMLELSPQTRWNTCNTILFAKVWEKMDVEVDKLPEAWFKKKKKRKAFWYQEENMIVNLNKA
ncbi:hypothetical protein CR513_12397, partial [Mucuna pruriens]